MTNSYNPGQRLYPAPRLISVVDTLARPHEHLWRRREIIAESGTRQNHSAGVITCLTIKAHHALWMPLPNGYWHSWRKSGGASRIWR